MSNIQLSAALSTYLAIVPIGVTTKDANWFGSNAKPFPCGKKCSTDQNSAPPGMEQPCTLENQASVSYLMLLQSQTLAVFSGCQIQNSLLYSKTTKPQRMLLTNYYRKIVSLKCADGFGKENQQFLYTPRSLTEPLKIDGWKTILSFRETYFQGICQFSRV